MTPRPDWAAAISKWLSWFATGAPAKDTVNLRRYQLARLATDHPHVGPWQVTAEDLAAWLAERDWGRETRRSYLAAVRSFYGHAHAHGIITVDPSRLLRRVPPAKRFPRAAPERVVDAALLRADKRQRLMLMLGSRHGMRRAEIAQVHSRDLVENFDGTWSLVVHGKGSKDRLLPLLGPTAAVLRALPAGWVFPNGFGSHLSPAYCGKLMSRAMAFEAVPHALRHRFATMAYRRSKDILNVRDLLGHANVATTQIYVSADDRESRSVLESAA